VRRLLRIAIVVDPFRRPRRGTEHPAALAGELLGRGHVVRGFGAPTGAIPGGGADLGADLDGFRPDVILAYVLDSPAAFKGARAAGRVDAPLVVLEEGFPARGHACGRLLRAVGHRLWGALVRRRAARLIALDPIAQGHLLARGFHPSRVVLQAPGVDLARYRPGLTSHLLGDHGVRGRILLVQAALREEVGLDQLLRAFAETVGRGGAWSLVFCGEGPAGPALRALAHQVGVGAQVHWLPPAPREALPGLYGAATLMLAPDDPADVAGWRVRRALACGLPVLAKRSLGLTALVEHDGCGLLVDGDGVAGWAEALRQATVAPQRRRRWRERARVLAESRYEWASVADRVEQVLFDALEEWAAATSEASSLPPSPS